MHTIVYKMHTRFLAKKTCRKGYSVREGEFKTFRGSSAKSHAAVVATIGANVGATIGGTIGGAFVYIPLPLH